MGGKATVCGHLMQGLLFTREHVGSHGIPLFLNNDWNDSLKHIAEEGNGESAFVFFQAAHAAYELKILFEKIEDRERAAWAQEYYQWCRDTYPVLWDGKWFLRGFNDRGEKYGTDEDEDNNITSGKLPREGARSRALLVDDIRIEGNLIPLSMLEAKTEVKVEVLYS